MKLKCISKIYFLALNSLNGMTTGHANSPIKNINPPSQASQGFKTSTIPIENKQALQNCISQQQKNFVCQQQGSRYNSVACNALIQNCIKIHTRITVL